ncbi:EamA family transporter [Alkalibacillus aidingensis]|uniref:EamA family transporter n=1 Tax=Alkalibacillus aidingensis TaxID=2747607 RepID=UPI001660A01B|nr:DMT family transporter [Alkalibacillus aidingensis]
MKIKGMIFVLIGAASFGFTPIFVKTGFDFGYSLGQITLTQMIVALAFLWGLSLIKGFRVQGIGKGELIKILASGTFVGLTGILYYGAMIYLPASLAIILLFQFVWVGMIFEWFFTKVKPSRINLVSMVIILLGVFFASELLEGGVFDFPTIGLVLGFLSAFSYAGFIFFSGHVGVHTHPIMRSTLMISGSTVLILIVFFQDIPTLPLSEGRLWLVAAGIALVGAVLPPLFFAGGAPLISGRLANVLSSIELPVAIVSAMIILTETVSGLQWLGIALIIVAIFVNELGEPLIRKASVKNM